MLRTEPATYVYLMCAQKLAPSSSFYKQCHTSAKNDDTALKMITTVMLLLTNLCGYYIKPSKLSEWVTWANFGTITVFIFIF